MRVKVEWQDIDRAVALPDGTCPIVHAVRRGLRLPDDEVARISPLSRLHIWKRVGEGHKLRHILFASFRLSKGASRYVADFYNGKVVKPARFVIEQMPLSKEQTKELAEYGLWIRTMRHTS